MQKNLKYRILVLATIVIISTVFFFPSTPLFKSFPGWWKKYMPNKGISLGLDLQGGIHLVLKVESEKAVQSNLERIAVGINEDMIKKGGFEGVSVGREGSENIKITLPQNVPKEKIEEFLNEKFPQVELKNVSEGKALYSLKAKEVERIKDSSVSQALETIRNRIDQFGVTEPIIVRQGTDEIVVQLPGVKDPKRAIDLIGKTAQLEFKILDEGASMEEALKGNIPEGDEVLYGKNTDSATGSSSKVPYLLKKNALLTGETLTEAKVNIDSKYNEPYVSISFESVGAAMFEKITGDNVGKRLAIVLDNTVYSAPSIREKISGGQAQISGRFTMEEAKDLAIILRAGALPAPVKILQNVTVGPSLGQDSIDKGVLSAIIGAILVVGFMALYYRLSGIIANFALLLNVIVLLGALAWFNATLTLPGIAGIILTIGMAVDSNVLIFERIKEELRQGRTVRTAIEGGYDKAFLTVVDSHITTLITAVVLFQFGTGPIKGFAVSLSLGVLINLYSALVGTRVVFDYMNLKKPLEKLSI